MRVQLITGGLFESVLEQARQSPRKRTNFNFHPNLDDNPHRFLNVMLRGTYIAPHRHADPPKSETFLVLRGRIAFFLFAGAGRIETVHLLGEGGEALGIDVAAGIWHTLTVLTPHAVCFEVKPGPYSAANDKDFAPWAPREGDDGVEAYLQALLARVSA